MEPTRAGGYLSHLNGLILIALLVVAAAAPRLGDRWFACAETLASGFAKRKRLVLLTVALTAMSVRLALLWLFPIPGPEVHDEFSYLLAADTFAHGRLANPPHPMWVFFDTFHVLQHPTYASKFPPAQGAVLALGQLLGHPWIGVLLSMAAMTTSITWMLQGWFPARWALLGAVFVLVRFDLFSYWMNSYWGGAVAATGGALVLGTFPRIIRHRRLRDSFLLGIGAGLLANSRPLEGFLFCFPVAVALLVWLFSQKRPALTITGPRVLVPATSVLLVTLLFVGYYDWRVTGNVLLPPEALTQRQYENLPLFAWQAPNPPLQYSNRQFNDFYNTRARSRYRRSSGDWTRRSWERCKAWWKFFLGITLSLPVVTLPWLFRDRRIRLLLIQFFCSALGLLAVVYFEPHYAAPLTATLLALLVQATRHLRVWKFSGRPVGMGFSRVIVLAVLANVPLYVWSTMKHSPPDEPWNVSRANITKQLEATPDLHLVIVRYTEHHTVDDEWVYNAADIDRSKVVWAREIPGRNLQPLLDYFQGRKVWLLEADASPPRLQPYTKAEAQAN